MVKCLLPLEGFWVRGADVEAGPTSPTTVLFRVRKLEEHHRLPWT